MTRHLCIAAVFTALVAAWTYPLVLQLSTHLPGAALGDNAAFLWNFWWMRTALAHHTSYFHTTYLFAPVGTDLTLNTHTAAAAFAGATLLGSLSPITALNVTTLASLVLNGVCAYLLAWRITRDRLASISGGLVFGMSPYIAAHLNGHFNLIAAWPIPLFALALLSAADPAVRGADPAGPRSLWPSLAAGAILGFTAYIDYYYVVYECALAVCIILAMRWRWSIRFEATKRLATAFKAVVALAMIDLVLMLIIADTFNLRQAFWILVVAGAWLYWSPRISAERQPAPGAFMRAIVTLAAAALVASPLAWHAWEMARAGDYATQRYFWRSAPNGIDLATLVLGNPFQGIWGTVTARAYDALAIDRIEQVAWPGIAPLALAIYAYAKRRRDPAVRLWLFVGTVFFVWSLGSHVHARGMNSGMIGPAAVLQFIPIVSNARIPGRAMVVVYLALAMLAAIGFVEFRARGIRGGLALVVAAIALDFWVAPFPTVRLECPQVYTVLRDRPEQGSVAELPLGVGDGLGALTKASDRTMLACQMIHQRPIVGGWVARLSPRVRARYESDPLLARWMQLSGAHIDPPPMGDSAAQLHADGIAFVLLNRAAASAELRDHVEHQLTLRLISEDADRALYVVP